MIPTKELRTGITIRNVYADKYVTLTIKVLLGILFTDAQGTDEYDPIPLTPEILEAAGFINEEDGEWTKDYFIPDRNRNNHHRVLCLNTNGTDAWAAYADTMLISSLWHLHQLQNLYFTLTGQELTVTL